MAMDWAALDAAFEESQAECQGNDALARHLAASTAKIPNGYYTVTFRDGSHRTFRIHTQKLSAKFAAGKRVVSLLIGPDNSSDYEMVAFLGEAGPVPFKRHRNTRTGVHLDMLWDLANGGFVDGCDLSVSKRCLLCNHNLTDPESIERGIGPSCWEKMSHE